MVDHFSVIYVSCLSCCFVCSSQPCGHLMGKDCPFGSLVCDVFLCFCHLPMMCPDLWHLIVSIPARYLFLTLTTLTLNRLFIRMCLSDLGPHLWHFLLPKYYNRRQCRRFYNTMPVICEDKLIHSAATCFIFRNWIKTLLEYHQRHFSKSVFYHKQ